MPDFTGRSQAYIEYKALGIKQFLKHLLSSAFLLEFFMEPNGRMNPNRSVLLCVKSCFACWVCLL